MTLGPRVGVMVLQNQSNSVRARWKLLPQMNPKAVERTRAKRIAKTGITTLQIAAVRRQRLTSLDSPGLSSEIGRRSYLVVCAIEPSLIANGIVNVY